MGQVRYRPKHGTLGTDEVEELQVDVQLLSLGMAYQVDGARELLQEIITQRAEMYKHKKTLAEEQRKTDIVVLRKAAAKPTTIDIGKARRRLGAEI